MCLKLFTFYLTLSLSFAASALFASTLSGIIKTEDGKPLPYATLYVAGTNTGSTTNIEGRYTLSLKPGTYTIVFQYVGYKKEVRSIRLGESDQELNITMTPEALQLREVIVNAQNEDPAYKVIRNTIRKKDEFQQEINAYECLVYMKGLQRLDDKPNRILGMNITLDTGIVYLSESVSQLRFHQPNHIQETMISSKVSGNQGSFSFNQASETLFSIYDNLFKVEGINERGYISPLAKNAFFFYDYKLAGIIQEGEYLINKIKVIPRRPTDPTFSGYLYVIENLWRVSRLDLKLTKEHQLEFLDELSVKQVHAPIGDSTWVMLSQNFEFYLNTFGFKGSGYFSVNYYDYKIELNPKFRKKNLAIPTNITPQEERINQEAQTPKQGDIYTEIDVKDFRNEILKIEEGSNKRSEDYWSQVRPVPLTTIEKLDYQKKDSLEVVRETKSYKDSVDAITNELTLGKMLYSGYRYQNSYQDYQLAFPSLINIFQYNTVEGFVTHLSSRFTKYEDNTFLYSLTPELRYGLASEQLYGQLHYKLNLNQKKFQALTVGGGHFIRQINQNAISPLINSLETLLNRKNYMKLYERNFIHLEYQQELFNGFFLKPTLVFEDRKPLINHTDYSLFYQDSRNFSLNNPENTEGPTDFTEHQALIFQLEASFRFGQKYMTMPNKKIILENKYPKLNLYYTKGFQALGSDIDYDQLSLELEHNLSLGLVGESDYVVEIGNFFNQSQMEIMDYQHFSTNASILSRLDKHNFQLLDYYNFSTNKYWIEGHYAHHFNGFIFNKIPLARKTKVQAVASVHYLHTPAINQYMEFGIGLEHIFKLLRLDYYNSIQEGKHQSHGIRLGFGF